jgi:protease YdgD
MVECDQKLVLCSEHPDCFSCLSNSCVFTEDLCTDYCTDPQLPCLHTAGSLQEASDLCTSGGTEISDYISLFTRPGCVCSDQCLSSHNGECDDGGPDATSAWCAPGSDCSDCGASDRKGASCIDPTLILPPQNNGDATELEVEAEAKADGSAGRNYAVRVCVCDDSCIFASDGECDDPGPGSILQNEPTVCGLGTDCSDCGISLRSKPMSAEVTSGHSCTAKPGEAVDGSATDGSTDTPTDGSTDTSTDRSTDTSTDAACLCDDSCNYRYKNHCPLIIAHKSLLTSLPTNHCSNHCPQIIAIDKSLLKSLPTHCRDDGECDDGGPGSITSHCPLGSDCADCGGSTRQYVSAGAGCAFPAVVSSIERYPCSLAVLYCTFNASFRRPVVAALTPPGVHQ